MPRHNPDAELDSNEEVKKKTSYSWARKRRYLMQLDKIKAEGTPFPLQVFHHKTGVALGVLRKWVQERKRIFRNANKRGNTVKTRRRNVPPKFPKGEMMLYGRFMYMRVFERVKVHRKYLREAMVDIVKRKDPDGLRGTLPLGWRPSEGWASNFCRRWEISSQCITNNHTQSITERMPQMQAFHRFLIYDMQHRLPRRCPKYGRFPQDRIYHMDQSPLPFASTGRKTLSAKREQVHVKTHGGSGDLKRFCTLQICICAQGNNQIVKIEIYFRGQGLRVTRLEREHFEKLKEWVTVRFQSKAWSDGQIALDWLVDFRAATLHQGEVLLGMDGHKAQISPLCRAFMDLMGIRYAITAANCTDTLSPVDRHVGVWLKDRIHEKYDAQFSGAKMSAWQKNYGAGGLSVSSKRMWVATWTAEAWQEMKRDQQYVIEQSFVQTGFVQAMDGSEQHLIRPWKQHKRKDDPDTHSHSNLSPEGLPYQFGPPPPPPPPAPL